MVRSGASFAIFLSDKEDVCGFRFVQCGCIVELLLVVVWCYGSSE